MREDPKDKIALVTGASAGIGAAVATALATAGMSVVLVARREDQLARLVASWPSDARGRAVVSPTDVTDADAVARLFDSLRRRGAMPDIVTQAAGASRPVRIDAPESAWVESMALNFHAVRRIAQAALPSMIERAWGRILTITGSSEPVPIPIDATGGELSALNAANSSKAATHAWSKGLSREVGRFGVTVNSIAPGRILSEQVETRLYPDPEMRRTYAREHIPVGRFGEPEEVAHLVSFLASENAGYITGEIVHVDGGMRHHAF